MLWSCVGRKKYVDFMCRTKKNVAVMCRTFSKIQLSFLVTWCS